MTRAQALAARLFNQRLTGTSRCLPEDVVAWLGAVQSQDYAGAVFALALRCRGADEANVNAAFDAGRILRTHVLRPTWHFVAPADIRWMLQLTGPRVEAMSAFYYRQHQLTPHLFSRCHTVFERALSGGVLTRAELGEALKRARIEASGVRLGLIAMQAELQGVICSGPRRGRQFTYALIDERVPKTAALTRDESLAALTGRYFASHGPATVRDFAWWSGLTLREVRTGLALAASHIEHASVDGATVYFVPMDRSPRAPSGAFLLPNYDEFLIAYKDRGLSVGPRTEEARPSKGHDLASRAGNPIFAHQVVVDGRVVGAWRRTVATRHAEVGVSLYNAAPARTIRRVETAANAFSTFLDRPVRVRWSQSRP